MKFPTQHKKFKVYISGKSDPIFYTAHRNSKQIWVTGGVKNTTLMSKTLEHVSKAKKWMSNPYI